MLHKGQMMMREHRKVGKETKREGIGEKGEKDRVRKGEREKERRM